MGSTSGEPVPCSSKSCYINGVYPSHAIQAPPHNFQLPPSPNSSVTSSSPEDVDRFADVFGGEEEVENNINSDDTDIKDIILLRDGTKVPEDPMIHINVNKISLWEEYSRDHAPTDPPPLNVQMFMKDILKDGFVNLAAEGNLPSLIVLEGADGGVAMHKWVLAAHSKLFNNKDDQIELRESNTIKLPDYSKRIIQKVVEMLYTGEIFYSESERQDINLIWEIMENLQISFDDKSFYSHPVEEVFVKEEVEEGLVSEPSPSTLQLLIAPPQLQLTSQQATSIDDAGIQSEVDQTKETWCQQDIDEKDKHAFAYRKVIRHPHPLNPTKSVYVHSQFGKGKNIQRVQRPVDDVVDETEEEDDVEVKQEVQDLLSKHKTVVIDLVGENDDPSKIVRKIYPAGTTVIGDEEFKNLVDSGKLDLNALKQSFLKKQASRKRESTQPQQQNQSSDTPSETPVVIIPPNKPERTGITFMANNSVDSADLNGSPTIQVNAFVSSFDTGTTYDMPTLQPVANPEPEAQEKRVRKFSGDITDLPELPKLNIMREHNYGRKRGKRKPTGDNSTNGNNDGAPNILAAAVIPASRVKVNRSLENQQAPPPPSVSNNELESSGTNLKKKGNAKRRKLTQETTDIPLTSDSNGELTVRHQEAHQQQHDKPKKKAIKVVGSKNLPIPENTKNKMRKYIKTGGNQSLGDIGVVGVVYDNDELSPPFSSPQQSFSKEPTNNTTMASNVCTPTASTSASLVEATVDTDKITGVGKEIEAPTRRNVVASTVMDVDEPKVKRESNKRVYGGGKGRRPGGDEKKTI